MTPVTWKNNRGSNEYDYGYATKYNFPRFHSMQLRLDFGPVPAKDALDRFFWFAAGEYPRGRYGRHESNEKWQGWLKDDGTRNKFLIHEMMEAVCRYKDEHRKSMIKQVHFHSNPKWQHSICACLDPDRDAELKKIEGRLRVECHSAACVGGGNNVYMFAPTNPCTTIQVCNQSVNVTAEKALLKNINLNCTISGPVTPKNTSSANEDLGSRKVPSSMMKNSVKENGNCDADYKAMVKAGTSEKIGPDHPHRCSEAAPVCSCHVTDTHRGKCTKMKHSVKETGSCDADYNAMVKAGTSERIKPDCAGAARPPRYALATYSKTNGPVQKIVRDEQKIVRPRGEILRHGRNELVGDQTFRRLDDDHPDNWRDKLGRARGHDQDVLAPGNPKASGKIQTVEARPKGFPG